MLHKMPMIHESHLNVIILSIYLVSINNLERSNEIILAKICLNLACKLN